MSSCCLFRERMSSQCKRPACALVWPSPQWGGRFPRCQKIGGCLVLVCPVSGVGKKDGQNKKFSSASRQNKKKAGKEWAGPPTKTGQYLNYRQLIRDPKHKEIWSTSAANEFLHIAQGVQGRVKETNTIFFICKDQVPKDRIKDMTYGSYGCEIKPNKEEQHCT